MILSILIGRYRRKMSSGSRLKRKSDVNMVTFDIHEKREYLNSRIQFPTRTSPNDSDSRPCIVYEEYERKNTNDEIRVNRVGFRTSDNLLAEITWPLL